MENEFRRAQREALNNAMQRGGHFQQNPNFLAALAAASAAGVGLRSPPTLVPPTTSLAYTSIPPSPIPQHGPYSMTSPSPGSQPSGNDNSNQQTWSFEEQFKQVRFFSFPFSFLIRIVTPSFILAFMAETRIICRLECREYAK
jgi:hypothetical protein